MTNDKSAMPESTLPDRSDAEPAPLEWTWDPWRERPRPARIAMLACAASAAALVATGVGWVLAVILALAVAGTLSPLLVPSRCRVDQAGVAVRGAFGWERRSWSTLRRARATPDGFLVSPFARPHRLDAFRALALPLPADRRAALLPPLRAHLEHHGL